MAVTQRLTRARDRFCSATTGLGALRGAAGRWAQAVAAGEDLAEEDLLAPETAARVPAGPAICPDRRRSRHPVQAVPYRRSSIRCTDDTNGTNRSERAGRRMMASVHATRYRLLHRELSSMLETLVSGEVIVDRATVEPLTKEFVG